MIVKCDWTNNVLQKKHEMSKSFWNQKCRKIIKKMRKLRKTFIITQNENDWKLYLKSCDVKQKTIKKVKTMKFQKTINDNANDKAGIWRWVKWTKNKNYMSKKIPKMPTMIRKIQKKIEIKQIVNFKNKMELLYDEFFFAFFSTNLNDILKMIYLTKVNYLKLIIKHEMKQKMRWFQICSA